MIPVSNVEITYLCDGVAKEFPFPYEYYDKSHVVGFVIGADGITTKITTNFTFNEVSKKFIYPVEGTALLSGNKIKLRRVTELSQTLDLPNEYPFGNIELAQDKLTMIMQELNYIGATSVPEIEQSFIDKLNTVIINTNTVKEYEAYALQHRNDAETFKNNASSSASNALTSANKAKTSEDNAKLSETNAKTSETNAKTSETNVNNTINQAVAGAVSATITIANNAKASEDKAKVSELNAKTSENNAKTSELNAQTYATESNSVIGVENHIAKGLKVTGTNGFNVDISAGVIVANEIRKAIPAQTKTLDPIKTALLYADTNGNIDKINAQYPIDMIDNNTVGFWVFNKTGNIPNSAVGKSSIAVANDLVPAGGTTLVDGHCDKSVKLDGTSGVLVSQNNAGIPIGTSVREFTLMFTVDDYNTSRNNTILSIGGNSGTNVLVLNINSTGNIEINNYTTILNTNYTMNKGGVYNATIKYDGTNIKIYINGILIYNGVLTLTTASSNLYIGNYVTGSYFCGITLHYLSIRNALRTDEQTAQIANKLLLPCFYDSAYPANTDISNSANAICSSDYSTGYYKTNAFDKNTGTWWGSGEITANQSGISYIGNLFGKSVKIAKATIMQHSAVANCLTSVKLQYTTDKGATWNTIGTYALAQNANLQEFSIFPVVCNGMRWLANNNLASGDIWAVHEVTFVTDSNSSIRKSITEILPANSVSVVMVKATSAGVTAYNDSDYMYGRREGAYGGNRRVFLGWKATKAGDWLYFDNPFSTKKVKLKTVWAQDATGLNEQDCNPYYVSGSLGLGVFTNSYTNCFGKGIAVFCGVNGVTNFNGTWQTGGYIGVYAEVLE